MSSTPSDDCWGIIIDTNLYAGNFEREMTAHITGVVGDCGKGKEYVEDCFFEENRIKQVADDRGTYRPTTIWHRDTMNSDVYYSSVLIYFESKPTDEEIAIVKERASTFPEAKRSRLLDHQLEEEKEHVPEIEGFRLIEFKFTQTYHEV